MTLIPEIPSQQIHSITEDVASSCERGECLDTAHTECFAKSATSGEPLTTSGEPSISPLEKGEKASITEESEESGEAESLKPADNSDLSKEVERFATLRHHHVRAETMPSSPIPFWENMPDEPTLIQSICRSAIALTARFVSGATPRWLNSQPDTCQRIYFANHTSNIDGPIIWATLPPQIRRMTRPVAAADYWRKSFVRRFVTQKVFNTILIDRKEVSIRQNPISIILREMGTRYSIIIFPEGRRSTIGDMLEFKSGLYYLAKKRPDLELIPVYLNNMNRVLPRGEVLPVPLLSTVNFGSPLWLEAGETKQDFLQRARGEIIRMRERVNQ